MNTRVPAAPAVFHAFEQYIYSFHKYHEQILKQHVVSPECIHWKLFHFKVKFQGGCSRLKTIKHSGFRTTLS